MSTSEETNQTQRHWDQLAVDDGRRRFHVLSWGGVAQVQQNHNFLITGDPHRYWVDDFIERYFPDRNAGKTLALGCGEGSIERLFFDHGLRFASLTGIDISEGCIAKATAEAEKINLAPTVAYRTGDLNVIELPRRAFDFIFFFHSLHHVENVGSLLSRVSEALKTDGVLLVNEFVGPSRFQWTDLQLLLANALFQALPAELRYDLAARRTKEKIKRSTVEEMISADPSEAVNSASINKALRKHFYIVEEKNWGGTDLNLIFENTAGNFDGSSEIHNAIASLLVGIENNLVASGLIPSDFKHYVARKRRRFLGIAEW